jgi:hypothetical protein
MTIIYNQQRAGTTMHQVTHSDFSQLVQSYMPAAGFLRLGREDVEKAIRNAMRFGGCPSCRHSRAPGDALGTAMYDDRLAIYERSCVDKHLTGLQSCPFYERLKIEE